MLKMLPCPSFLVVRRQRQRLLALALAPLLAAPALGDESYCGIINGRFVKDCPGAKAAADGPRAAECERIGSELAGQVGMGSFAAIMKKEDLQKIYQRRCNTTTTSRAKAGDTPECDRIAHDYYSLAGQSVQSALFTKQDLLRQYDTRCAAPPPSEIPAAVIITR